MFEFFGTLTKDRINKGKPFRFKYGEKIIEANYCDIGFYANSISEILSRIDVDDFDEIRIKRK